MKLKSRDVKKVLYTGIVLLLLIVMRMAVLAVVAVRDVSFSIDPLLSEDAQHLIANQVMQDDMYKTGPLKIDQALRVAASL